MLAFLGSCVPLAGPFGSIAGIVLGIVALGALALWARVCGKGMCGLLRSLRTLFIALAAVAAVIAIVMLGTFNPCWLAMLAIAVLLALAAFVLASVGAMVGCP